MTPNHDAIVVTLVIFATFLAIHYLLSRLLGPKLDRLMVRWFGPEDAPLRDAARKGRTASGARNGIVASPERQARGERHGSARLTESAVLELRRLRENGISHRAIARHLGVSQSTVSYVLAGRTWRHVGGSP